MLSRMWRNWNPYVLLVGMDNGAVAMKTVLQFLKKLKIGLSNDLATPFLGIYPQRIESSVSKRHLYTYVHSSISHNNQKAEATLMSNRRSMDKHRVDIHIMEYYLTFKRKEILRHATTQMNSEEGHYAK